MDKHNPYRLPEEEELRSSVSHLEDIKESAFWRDFRMILEDRIEVAQRELLEKASNMEQVNLIRGEILAIKSIFEIPDQFIAELEYDHANSNKD